MHQPCQCWQVGHVEIVGLVEHQVARHQPQHRRDLATAAQAFGGRGEMVHRADQQRCDKEAPYLGVIAQALQQGVLFAAFIEHGPAFIQ